MNAFHRYGQMTLAMMLSLGLLFMVFVGTASAHAKVLSSDPKMGSTIPEAPTTVTVTTAENMKPGPQSSNLFIYGPSGDLVSQGDAKVDINNPMKMSVTIKPEKKPGIYVVRWITVSADDGDPAQGAFVFTVNPTTSTASTAPTKPAQPAPASSGTPLWITIVTGLVTLLVGLAAGVGLGRRGTATATSEPIAELAETATKDS